MSSRTKILVFHMKELIYTGIFVVLGILFIILLAIMFSPKKEESPTEPDETESVYVPGIYSTTLVLGDHTVNVEVLVDATTIQSVSLKNLDEAVTTMYPLIQPSFEDIASQIEEKQSLEDITYSEENQYTCRVLLDAIRSSLDKATPTTDLQE